jgi:hypothetical protein
MYYVARSGKLLYLPRPLARMIEGFLGRGYWAKRRQLTELNRAVQIMRGPYGRSAYWEWRDWRARNAWGVTLRMPYLPERLRAPCPYMVSLDPPIAKLHPKALWELRDRVASEVHFRN